MENLDGRKTLQVKFGTNSAQGLQHLNVITEGQGGMQAADNMQFRDPDRESFTRFLDDVIHGELKAVGVALFAGERAELAAQDAVVRIVDVAVQNVARAIAALPFPHEIRDCADGVEVFAFEKAKSIRLGNTLRRDHFFVDISKIAVAKRKRHQIVSLI